MNKYIVASCREWNRPIFDAKVVHAAGEWEYVSTTSELEQALTGPAPRYVFFLHWNDIVSRDIWQAHECICFHMTDVPYGRGGSPLQNLIKAGHTHTKLTALRMVADLDAGPVYCKKPLSLEGRAEDIYKACTQLSWDIINDITDSFPAPAPQTGDVVTFKRRTPAQSILPDTGTMRALHDHIRMLDAPGYPFGFLDHGPFRIEFTQSRYVEGEIKADVTIRLKHKEES